MISTSERICLFLFVSAIGMSLPSLQACEKQPQADQTIQNEDDIDEDIDGDIDSEDTTNSNSNEKEKDLRMLVLQMINYVLEEDQLDLPMLNSILDNKNSKKLFKDLADTLKNP